MTRVKICGITSLDNAVACVEAGADLLGLNFYAPSPRSVEPEQARVVVQGLRARFGQACPLLVGVFVNADAESIDQLMRDVDLDLAQLSGDEPADVLEVLHGPGFKTIRPRTVPEALKLGEEALRFSPAESHYPALLVDAYHKALYGGTGEAASIAVATAVNGLSPRVMLAGGLNPANVAARVRAIRPWGVDVASGVENSQPGIKAIEKVEAFVAAIREVDGELC